MQAVRRVLVCSALAMGALSWIGSSPAGAAVAVAVDGTRIVVTATGEATVAFACDTGTGNVLVNGAPTDPTLPCATLTKATVNGDDGAQAVDGRGLDAPAFAAGPTLTALMGGGSDTITGTARPDGLVGGPGADLIILHPSAQPDTSINIGPDSFDHDTIRFVGTSGDDVISVSRGTNPSYPYFTTEQYAATISWSSGGATAVTSISSPYYPDIRGGAGNDTLTVVNPYDALRPRLEGGAGDDTIDTAGAAADFDGGIGANTLLGSTGHDTITTRSERDTIDGRGGNDGIVDATSARSFGRTIAPTGPYGYLLELAGDLGAVRIRPSTTSGTTTRMTSSLSRPGQIDLGPDTTGVQLFQRGSDGANDSTLIDVVLHPGLSFGASGRAGGQDLVDITVPYGAWTRHDESGATIVMPQGEGLTSPISLNDMDEVSVHGPWTDLDEGFVHRIVRDTFFTFVDDAGRAQRTAAIKAGTVTRAGFVDQIMADDVYRYLEVDRVFLKYLHRGVDPSGRSYWVSSIKNGKALWRFRAQLFGSNEYFAKAGGTNAAYVAQAYTDVLGRAPDPSGQAYWTDKLTNGADRGQVALQFINAPETRRRLVDDQYLRFLDRLPTPAEQAAGVSLLLSATGEQQLTRSLAVSDEYYHRS